MSARGTAVSLASRVGGSVVAGLRSAVGAPSQRPGDAREPSSGWLVVTVLRDVTDLDGVERLAPLAELGAGVEVRCRPAPADRGTELAVRRRGGSDRASARARLSGQDPQADVRSALRQAKQLLEVGEVLAVDPTPHGERTSSPAGSLVEAWTARASRAGVR